jgi:Na+/H+ antiporter NhaD/arsenite permease-like protein
MQVYVLLAMILTGFVLMSWGKLTQEVALPMIALAALVLAGAPDNLNALQGGFAEYSRILLIFSAVAVPAHLLQRAKALSWIGLLLGEWIGVVIRKTGAPAWAVVPVCSLFLTWTMAAAFHNTTSILVCSQIIVVICESYYLPILPVLSGALVASNLGGFSTRWGDTPNIIEAAEFNLAHGDFFREILPANLFLLALVSIGVTLWIKFKLANMRATTDFETALATFDFQRARQQLLIDTRLLWVGLCGIAGAVVMPMLLPAHELAIAALVTLTCVLLDRSAQRRESLTALGLETYATLAGVFVLAHVLTHSRIGVGDYVQHWLVGSGMSVWAIAIASYFGTLFTEAASWASAAAPIVHAAAPTHKAAWALGGGICAGSSSLVTAATAGILLSKETKQLSKEDRVTFGSYALFGLVTSAGMLAYYIVVLTAFGH